MEPELLRGGGGGGISSGVVFSGGYVRIWGMGFGGRSLGTVVRIWGYVWCLEGGAWGLW